MTADVIRIMIFEICDNGNGKRRTNGKNFHLADPGVEGDGEQLIQTGGQALHRRKLVFIKWDSPIRDNSLNS
jgi:hypothetical protein